MDLRESSHGFTLAETMVVAALIAIVATVAIPSWRSWQANSDLKSAAYQVAGIIQWARSEAAKQNACMGIDIAITGNAARPGGAITVFHDDACDATKGWVSALNDADDQCNANRANPTNPCLRRMNFANTVSLFAAQDTAFSINPRGLIRNGPVGPFSVSLGSSYNKNAYQLMISPASAVRIDSK